MEWLVNIFPKAAPKRNQRGPATTAREDELMALWAKHVEPIDDQTADGDYEDFIEQAYRLDAAIKSFGAENVWLRIVRRGIMEAFRVSTGERRTLSELEHLPRYGAQPESGGMHGWTTIISEARAEDYMLYDTFAKNAGRRTAIGGFRSEANDVADLIAEMNRDGINGFYVKLRKTKTGLFQISVPPAADKQTINKEFMAEASWAAIHVEGSNDSLCVQEAVEMNYEYRLFVAGHEVVTGAGCVEEFTPIDNNGAAFDNKARRNRSGRSPVESQPVLVNEMVEFGQRLALSFKDEVPDMDTYVMDVAIGADGKPLLIELNGMLNAGLYACQPVLITAGLAGEAQGAVIDLMTPLSTITVDPSTTPAQ